MAYYYPCKNCAVDKETCARRIRVKEAIAGLSVTSVKFKCEKRAPMFSRGQRVTFDWKYFETVQICQDYFEVKEFKLSFVGTVIAETKGGLRFAVRVDKKQDVDGLTPSDVFRNESLVINVKPSDMRGVDEPDRSFCPNCLAYDKDEAAWRCHSHDGDDWDVHRPSGCLRDRKDFK